MSKTYTSSYKKAAQADARLASGNHTTFIFPVSALSLYSRFCRRQIYFHTVGCRRKNQSDLFCVGTDCPVSIYHCIRAFLLWICLCIRKFWGCSSLCLCVDLQKNQEKAGETAGNSNSKLSKVKYVVLAVIVLLCFKGVYSQTQGYSPWDVFSMLHAFNFKLGGYLLGIVLLVLIMVGMALQERFFCRFLCPMGAVFSLLPMLPFFTLKREREQCIKGCSACTKQWSVRHRSAGGRFAGCQR